jgi:hypothetical protein
MNEVANIANVAASDARPAVGKNIRARIVDNAP